MGTFEENMKANKDILKEVASWSDPNFKPPSNVTGPPPAKGVANMALDNAQKSAEYAKIMMEK